MARVAEKSLGRIDQAPTTLEQGPDSLLMSGMYLHVDRRQDCSSEPAKVSVAACPPDVRMAVVTLALVHGK